MLILFLLLMLTIITLLFRNRKNKYAACFGIGLISVCLIVFSLILYIMKFSNLTYNLGRGWVIYKRIYRLNISFYDIRSIVNVAISVFSVSMFLISMSLKYNLSKLMKIIYSVCCCIILLVFNYANSNSFLEYLYIYRYEKNISSHLYRIAEVCIRSFSIFLIALSCLLPLIAVIRKLVKTKIIYKKRQYCMLLLALIVFQIEIISLIYFTPLKIFTFQLDLMNFIPPPIKGSVYILVTISVLLMIIVLSIYKTNVFSDVSFSRKKTFEKRISIQMTDLRHIFHTYKNAFLQIRSLNECAIENQGTGEEMQNLIDIKERCNNYIKQLSEFLNIYNASKLFLNTINIIDIIQERTSDAKKMFHIDIETNYSSRNIYVYGDKDYISEVFRNLFKNAADSLSMRENKSGGIICVNCWIEDDYVCISVWDNGIGVKKKMLKKIFTPFVTSKSSASNTGIGLAYVKNTIEAHLGFFSVRSKENEFFEIQMCFPIERTD